MDYTVAVKNLKLFDLTFLSFIF